MFYFYFESRNSENDPVVIWPNGGRVCSSELVVFYEIGPFRIGDNLILVWNEYGWDKASNLIYIDQPTGTGFSYSSDKRDIRDDEQDKEFGTRVLRISVGHDHNDYLLARKIGLPILNVMNKDGTSTRLVSKKKLTLQESLDPKELIAFGEQEVVWYHGAFG